MSVPSSNKKLLSATERKRLFNRKIDPSLKADDAEKLANVRKRNDLIVRSKIKRWLSDAECIKFALEHIPIRQLQKSIIDEELYTLLDISLILLDVLDFAPVQKTPFGQEIVITPAECRRVETYQWLRSLTNENMQARLAVQADFKRNLYISQYINALGNHCALDNDSLPEYKNYQENDIKKRLAKHGFNVL